MEDGGTVTIDYADCPEEMPETAPIVIFLHTITGSAKETGYFMRYAVRRGWRTCVFNRSASRPPSFFRVTLIPSGEVMPACSLPLPAST